MYLKKLPIGIQTLSHIIEDNYLYIDKTEIALNLIESGKYYFLSRPRRFGKSLFLSTLKAIFEGKKELFKNLYIYDKWNWEETYPVIHISFGGGFLKTDEDFKDKIDEVLMENENKLKIKCFNKIYNRKCFKDLIVKAYEKYNQKVVILIDEYDKPILDNIEKEKVAIEMRDNLKNIYSIIKDSDEYIKFAFLTGVSKFSKTSIFSGLNNLQDISLNPKYATICGYTQNDLKENFSEYLIDVDMEQLKLWYNGYNFLGDSVYNPFDILLFIANNYIFKNYWFETGTPTFLINLVKSKKYYLPEFEDLESDEIMVSSFDIENLSIETIMFQSGYLTIKEMIKKRNRVKYKLEFPNMEVKISFFDYLLNTIVNPIEKNRVADKIYDILEDKNLNDLESVLKRLFASIAYQNFTNNYIENYEGFYASVIYAYFASLGVELIAEDVTNRGRMDLTMKLDNSVFIFEFKVIDNKNRKNNALNQIKEKKYYEKYSDNEVFMIGIEFNKESRNIDCFEWEKLEK